MFLGNQVIYGFLAADFAGDTDAVDNGILVEFRGQDNWDGYQDDLQDQRSSVQDDRCFADAIEEPKR